MRLLAMASIPIVAIGVWVAVRALVGRPVRRFALNSVVGIALLAYFLITAGLGVFWVANQELPVFDPHYLFGYLTLALVAVHVWINGPLIVRFVRRRSRAMSAEGQTFRPSVAWAARLAGLALFGGVAYWIGYSRAASRVTVEVGERAAAPVAAGGEGMPEQIVREGGDLVPLSRWYFDRSSMSRRRAIARGPALATDRRPSPFETYAAEEVVPLGERAPVTMTTGAALDATREAPAGLGDTKVKITRGDLSALLHLTQGITSVTGLPGDPFHRRAAASSGALYPTVTHVVIADVEGLEPGLYHYEPKAHELHRLRRGDVRGELASAVAHPQLVAGAPFALVLSVVYYKSSWKYQERGYRYCLLDAGHVAANAIVAGGALGLATRAIARFDDAALGRLIGAVPHEQGPLLVLPFGAATAAVKALEPVFEPTDLALASSEVPTAVMLAASRTALRSTGRTAPPFATAPPLPPRTSGEPIALPAGDAAGDALAPTIERRRSIRKFGERPLPLAGLAAVLRRASSASVEDQRALRLHVVASRVADLAPGAYEYRAADHTLVRVRDGDLASELHGAALSQEVTERAAAVIVMSADAAQLAWPDASRGFRYAWLDAGIAAGRVYLMGLAQQLGVSSIGAFFDDDIVELLRLDERRELPSLLVAVGMP